MMWFFRHFWIFISYHIFLLNQVEGAIAIPPSNSAPLPLFCPSVCPSVCPSIGLLTTFSGFCTFADKSLGRNGIELEMQMFPDDLPLANIDADGYCCHFMRSSVRPTIHGLGFVYCIQSAWKKWPTIWHADVSRWLTLSIQYTCGYGGYLLPLLAAHSSSLCIYISAAKVLTRCFFLQIFERILFIWAIRHPASGYVQGMNDLVTPFFVVFLSEFIDTGVWVSRLEGALTHWGRDTMADIFQTFLNAFSWICMNFDSNFTEVCS